jgi:large subunit ribosomal protein L32
MAVAKRKQSKSRKRSRRAQWMKLDAPAFNKCPNCGEFRMSHRACGSCGWYGAADGGRVVIERKEENEQGAAKQS